MIRGLIGAVMSDSRTAVQNSQYATIVKRALNTNSKGDRPFTFQTAARMIPHPAKAAKGGEDAYFVHRVALGVADGVGGWTLSGVDPSKYSRALAAGAHARAQELDEADKSVEPLPIMNAGYKAAMDKVGSATFCVTTLVGNRLLTANLGDSGYMLYRHGELIYRSIEQQHNFNFPYQLGTNSDDTPDTSDFFEHEIEDNDWVIVGSDGLFDNVFDETITDMVRVHRNVDELADRLARLAAANGANESFESPFAAHAQSYGFDDMIGGKLDDVTVVIGRITAARQPPITASTALLGAVAVDAHDTLRFFEQTEFLAVGMLALMAALWCAVRRRAAKPAAAAVRRRMHAAHR
eukprot:TRINITY_DN2440_c0_g1_i6.p1 TRINITY_DN2440_c0_g1~~TRINITY_DN2440_c0_g1_i6.p1  ORF type:complete len:351 (-),score=171.56 TRINITY_DN2440_c0_g1_i6:55-1107(-)